MSAHSSRVLKLRVVEKEGLSLEVQRSATLPDSKYLLSKGGEQEMGKNSEEGNKK